MRHKERRKSPRFETEGRVHAQVLGAGQPVTLLDVSAGGFAIASDEVLPASESIKVRFEIPGRSWSTVLPARVAYGLLQRQTSGRHEGKYITGYAFVDAGAEGKRHIKELIHHVSLMLV
jgi:hypothetical protein